MRREQAVDVERLLHDVEWGMAHGFAARDLVPMLEKLVQATPPDTTTGRFARLHLAELLVERAPWRAAALGRQLAARGDDDRALAVLGLASTLLGHYRVAARSFRRALALCPGSPAHNHNLGHLLDVALERPREALRYLERALAEEPWEPEIASSLAHALARCDRAEEATRLLVARVGMVEGDAAALVARWLAASPPGSASPPPHPAAAPPR